MSKPKFVSSPNSNSELITVEYYDAPYFKNPLHYQKEFELAYIESSFGMRYIGSHIEAFEKGDLVLVGEGLCHLWKNDNVFYQNDIDLRARAIVVKFRINFAGNEFLKLSQSSEISKVLSQAAGGIKITGETNQKIYGIMQSMYDQSSFERILSVLEILNLLSKSEDIKILSNYDFLQLYNLKERDRINKIIQFTMLNFNTAIKLEEIADVANLSKSAFCRFFKRTYNKTYTDFLYEIRVEYACKILLEKKIGITEVCFETGFNSPSAFSQVFKKIKGQTPMQYRKSNDI